MLGLLAWVYWLGGAKGTVKVARAIREVADAVRVHRMLDGLAGSFEARARRQRALDQRGDPPDPTSEVKRPD